VIGRVRRIGNRPDRQQGQSLVEFTMVIPILLLILLSVLDFGMAFNHHLTIEYSTREGARVGGAMVNGGGTLGCNSGQSPNAATVDAYVIAAAQRVLASSGSPIVFANVGPIRIYELNYDGTTTGRSNLWNPTPDAGPSLIDLNGDGSLDPLDFSPAGGSFTPCSRTYVSQTGKIGPTSIGVSITYTYRFQFGLLGILGMINPSNTLTTIPIADKTVMAFNPLQ
jgi:hypothetical protein